MNEGIGKLHVKARVRSNSELVSHVHLVWLDAPAITQLARPGQFVMVRCGEDYDPLLLRPLSIHKTDSDGGMALLFNVVGRGTWWLSQRTPGDFVDLVGPLGNGFSIAPTAESLLLVGGGMGVAPLTFLAEVAVRLGKVVTLLSGAQTASLLCPRSHLPREVTAVSVTEDGSEGRKGVVTDVVSEFILQTDQVFACGPIPMYRSMSSLGFLNSRSVQVSLEVMMACGVGACYGCTVKTRIGQQQVCRDGPVFQLADIVW